MTVKELIEKLQAIEESNPDAPVEFTYVDSDEGSCYRGVDQVILTKDGVVLR